MEHPFFTPTFPPPPRNNLPYNTFRSFTGVPADYCYPDIVLSFESDGGCLHQPRPLFTPGTSFLHSLQSIFFDITLRNLAMCFFLSSWSLSSHSGPAVFFLLFIPPVLYAKSWPRQRPRGPPRPQNHLQRTICEDVVWLVGSR